MSDMEHGVCNPDTSCVCPACGDICHEEQMSGEPGSEDLCCECAAIRASMLELERAEADDDAGYHPCDPREGF